MRQPKILMTLALIGLTLSSCGKPGLSEDITFKALPANPLVINADFTLGSGTDAIIIKAPWYEFRYYFKNKNTTHRMVVVTLKLTITGNKNGNETTKEFNLDPGLYCDDPYVRPYLAIVDPGEEFTGYGVTGTSNCYLPGNESAAPRLTPPNYETWLPNDLPETDSNLYTVQIEASGWFESVATGEITERLYLTGFQTTR